MTIDWAALHGAFQMNMPEVRCFLAVEDGRVLKLPPGDPQLSAVRAEPQQFFSIDAIPSRIQYQWLAEFIEAMITDEDVRERMVAAINGKGAFRRFKDILLTLPDERRRWFEYRDQRMRQRIVEWVQEVGIQPENEAPWNADGLEHEPAAGAPVLAPEDGQPVLPGPPRPAKPPVPSSQRHDVEALRDFFVEWSDQQPPEAWRNPLRLDALADEVDQRFFIKARSG